MDEYGKLGWAIVLAAGDGTRLSSLTRDASGLVTPKQFCSLRGGRSLLCDAIERAGRLVERDRIVVIVAARHERWWRRDLASIPVENRVLQPSNKGTAAGVLLPLLSIVGRDPDADVFLVPSDHHVEREDVLAATMREGFARVRQHAQEILLFGMPPLGPETEYGWIVPCRGDVPAPRVETFVEKPEPSVAARLFEGGALWNSFLLAASAKTLLARYHEHMPVLLAELLHATHESGEVLANLYERLETRDFSRDLLQGCEEDLRVLPVPACGWTDLGTPERVAACIGERTANESAADTGEPRCFDLARAVSRAWKASHGVAV
jgi:mannose-1-phosphate guanylyltransferase